MSRTPKPQDQKRVLVGGFVLPKIKKIIADKAEKESRSESSVLAHFLESHPEIKRQLKAAA